MADRLRTLWGRVLSEGHELAPARIELVDGRIARLAPSSEPGDAQLVVYDGWIAPGLIDVQVNGAGGVDLSSARNPPEALEHVARTLARHGVTAFCPTIVSSPLEIILDRLIAYRARRIAGGAASLGVHVEGPFIDPGHRGVHDPALLRQPTSSEVGRWLAVGPPRIVTIAPETAGGLETIDQLIEGGVLVSLGHTGATAAQTQAALVAGASMATHLFNAMPPLHHRAPGPIGALLASTAALGIIADGVHLDPLIVDLVVQRAGPGRVVLVSDALASAAAPPGIAVLGGQTVLSDGRTVRRTDGTLAGSALLLDGCVRNLRAWLPALPPADIVRMASQTPADLLGLPQKGRVAVGADADLVIFDRDLQVRQTIVGGVLIEPTLVELSA